MHRDPLSGKAIRTFHTVTAKTRKTAEKRRNELIASLRSEEPLPREQNNYPVEMAVKDFLSFKEREGIIEASTLRGYRSRANLICQSMGSVSLGAITSASISEWMGNLSKEGYAPRTIAKTFQLLKQSLEHAASKNLLKTNPAALCKPPKARRLPFDVLDRKERTRMLLLARSIQPMPLGLAIELALTTGMRRGEICALRWSDLLADESITVRRALGEGPRGYYEKEPKTPESNRNIPLAQQTFQTLWALGEETKTALKKNPDLERNPYILGTVSKTSRPYNPSQLSKDFALLCKLNGFTCTFHGLRHTFATMMIAEGADIKTVSSYLGHANASMTLDVYAEADPEAKRMAVAKITGAFDL